MPAFVSVFAHTEAEAREVLRHCKNVKVRRNRNRMWSGNGEWTAYLPPPATPAAPAAAPLPALDDQTRAQIRNIAERMLDDAAFVRQLASPT